MYNKQIKYHHAVIATFASLVFAFAFVVNTVHAAQQIPSGAYLSTNQTVTANLDTKVNLTINFLSSDLTFASNEFTVVTAGYYLVNGQVFCSSAADNLCQAIIDVDGVQVCTAAYASETEISSAINSCWLNLSVGDVVSLYGKNQVGTTFFAGAGLTFLQLLRIDTSSPSIDVNFGSSTIAVENSSFTIWGGMILFMGAFWLIIWFFRRR